MYEKYEEFELNTPQGEITSLFDMFESFPFVGMSLRIMANWQIPIKLISASDFYTVDKKGFECWILGCILWMSSRKPFSFNAFAYTEADPTFQKRLKLSYHVFLLTSHPDDV